MTDAARAGGILTIDLDAIVANWRRLQAVVQPAECAAVVKADAYGLGAERVVPPLWRAGCTTFFVATVDEALAVRAGLDRCASQEQRGEATVYVLNGLGCDGIEPLFAEHRLRPVLNSLGEIDAWAAFGRQQGRALPAAVHVDTGMSRLGLTATDLVRIAAAPARLQGIDLSCVMSHLACADEPAHPLNRCQLTRFRDSLALLPPTTASLANSSGVFLGRDFHGAMVRPGIALYGGSPVTGQSNPMRPVIRLKGRILQVREIDASDTVGYGATYAARGPERIATVAIGYADGFLRSASGRAYAWIGETRIPLVGRVSMDLSTFEVTDVPPALARPGLMVELIGAHHPLDALAAEAGTIAYEILTDLGRRYHRVYVGGEGTPG
jgi:alanine racemase